MPSPARRFRVCVAAGALAPTRALTRSPTPAASQTPIEPPTAAPVDSGTRVRVTARRSGLIRQVARVAAVWPDSIRLDPLRPGLAPLTLPLRELDALALSAGRSSGAGARRGAAIGALVVFVPGAALTTGFLAHDWLADRNGNCGEWCYLGPVIFGVLTVGGTALGAASGALIGAAVGAERWRPVPLPTRVSLAPIVVPSRRGLALGLTRARQR
jgi:hypothetical protein